MMKFKEYLKKLQEDKIIAKEDEAVSLGDVSSPSTNSVSDGDIQVKSVNQNGGLSTQDILGHCDHSKDGFMGPGCMHRPLPVFTVIPSRIKRKKKKYIKVLDLTESEDFQGFDRTSTEMIKTVLDSINDYTAQIDPELSCEFNKDYEFDGEKQNWIGAIDTDTQDNAKIFVLAMNLPMLYQYLEEQSLENDDKEIMCQIKATLWHEFGHALIRYFRDQDIYDFEMTEDEEEKLVEEFSSFMMKEFTGTSSSRLDRFVKEIFGENRIDETDAAVSDLEQLKTMFTKPINIANRRLLPEKTVVKILSNSVHIRKLLSLDIDEAENIMRDGDNPVFGKLTFYVLDQGGKKIIGRVSNKKPNSPSEYVYWFVPTLIDIIRLCHGKVQNVPKDLITISDDVDNYNDFDKFTIKESRDLYADVTTSRYMLEKRPGRVKLFKELYKSNVDVIKSVIYLVTVNVTDGRMFNLVTKEGVSIGYTDRSLKYLTTVYFCEPSDIAFFFNKGTTEAKNGASNDGISMELLWNCFQNLVNGKSHLNHNTRKTRNNRRFIEIDD